MTLGAGTLGFFLLAVLCDHWLVSGGLGTVGRWLALVIYLTGALVYCWQSLLPLCLRRINPVYAAHAIERSKPTLKNSLINFLLLRGKSAELAPHVYEAIEQRAATELAAVPVEATIDRSKLIKIGYVFLGLMLAAAIYKVSSPKDPFLTVGRIVLPWSDIAPPTRVAILDVRPATVPSCAASAPKSSAEVHGVGAGQSVQLVYSTDDGQIVNRAIPMQLPTEGYLFQCELPEGKGGIQQDVKYRVVAGDATSNEFRLTVQAAPTIVIESVDYAYPSYTGMVSQTVDHQGDLKAIEGTQVTLHALANQPIKSAAIDFDANGSDDQKMTFDDRRATATFTLALKADRQSPEHTSYQIRFTNVDGKENLQPIRHQIEVTRDVAPEVQFLAPNRDEIDLPIDRSLAVEVSAHDPDFALARVAVVGQPSGGQPFERSLLEDPSKPGQPWQGQFRKKLVLVPKKLGLKVGDVLEYWAWAEDNKTPVANRTETIHRRARIVSPSKSETSPDALASRDQASDDQPSSGDDKQPGNESAASDDENAPDDQPEPGKPGATRRIANLLSVIVPPPTRRQTRSKIRATRNKTKTIRCQNRHRVNRIAAHPISSLAIKSKVATTARTRSNRARVNRDKKSPATSNRAKANRGRASRDRESPAKTRRGRKALAKVNRASRRRPMVRKTIPAKTARVKAVRPAPGASKVPTARAARIINRSRKTARKTARHSKRSSTDKTSKSKEVPPAPGKPPRGAAAPRLPTASQPSKLRGKKSQSLRLATRLKERRRRAERRPRTISREAKNPRRKNGPTRKTRAGEAEKKDAGKKGTDKKPAEGEKDPNGGSDDKQPATDGQSEGGEQSGEERSSADGEPTPAGKPTGKKSKPEGKQVNQTTEGQGGDKEQDSSDTDGQSGSEAGGQTKSGQPGKQQSGKPSSGKPAAENQPSDDPAAEETTSGQTPPVQKTGKKPAPQKKIAGSGDARNRATTSQASRSRAAALNRPANRFRSPPRSQTRKGSPTVRQLTARKIRARQAPAKADLTRSRVPANHKAITDQARNRLARATSPAKSAKNRQARRRPAPAIINPTPRESRTEIARAAAKKGPVRNRNRPAKVSQAVNPRPTTAATPPRTKVAKRLRISPAATANLKNRPAKAEKPKALGSKAGSPQSGARSKPGTDGKDSDQPDTDPGQGAAPSGKGGKRGPARERATPLRASRSNRRPWSNKPTRQISNSPARRPSSRSTVADQLNKGNVDQELLDRLQWSRSDIEALGQPLGDDVPPRQEQGRQGQAAQAELDATLR